MRKIAFWLSVIFIFTIPWEGITIKGLGSVARLAGLLAFAVWINSILFTGKIRRLHPFHLIMFLFVLWNIITLFWTVSVNATMTRLQTYVQLVLLVWLIWDLFTTSDKVKIGHQAYVLGAYVSVWSTISNYLVGKTTGNSGRYSGFGFNSNGLAMILVIGIPIAWHLAVSASADESKKGNILRFINFGYVPPAIFAILLTASRTAVLSAMPAFWFMLGSITRLKPVSRLLIAVAAVGALIFLQPLVPQTSIDRLSTTSDELSGGDLNGRTQLWEIGIASFKEHPILGVGSGAYKSINSRKQVAHNTYLSVLVETGLVGFLLFGGMLFFAIHQVRYQDKWMTALWFTVFLSWAVGVSAMTWEYRKPTWLIMSLVVTGAHILVPRNSSEKTPVYSLELSSLSPSKMVTSDQKPLS